MYYAIELFKQHDITIKDVPESHLDEIIEDLPAYGDRIMLNHPDGVVITNKKMLTFYCKSKEKRLEMLNNLLKSQDCFNNSTFFMNTVSSNGNKMRF